MSLSTGWERGDIVTQCLGAGDDVIPFRENIDDFLVTSDAWYVLRFLWSMCNGDYKTFVRYEHKPVATLSKLARERPVFNLKYLQDNGSFCLHREMWWKNEEPKEKTYLTGWLGSLHVDPEVYCALLYSATKDFGGAKDRYPVTFCTFPVKVWSEEKNEWEAASKNNRCPWAKFFRSSSVFQERAKSKSDTFCEMSNCCGAQLHEVGGRYCSLHSGGQQKQKANSDGTSHRNEALEFRRAVHVMSIISCVQTFLRSQTDNAFQRDFRKMNEWSRWVEHFEKRVMKIDHPVFSSGECRLMGKGCRKCLEGQRTLLEVLPVTALDRKFGLGNFGRCEHCAGQAEKRRLEINIDDDLTEEEMWALCEEAWRNAKEKKLLHKS